MDISLQNYVRHWPATTTSWKCDSDKTITCITWTTTTKWGWTLTVQSPASLGSIAISNPSNIVELEFNASIQVMKALKEAILRQEFCYASETLTEQTTSRSKVQKLRQDKAE